MLTAKWTSARRLKASSGSAFLVVGSLGGRSLRYWSMASWTDWVKSVFSSGRGDGDAVDEEHEVDAALVVQRVVDLAHHPAAHLARSAPASVRVEAVAGLELAEVEAGAAAFKPWRRSASEPSVVQQLATRSSEQPRRCCLCASPAALPTPVGCVSWSQPIRSSG